MRVQVIKEVPKKDQRDANDWNLCFQWCLYVYDDGRSENGYRFIWRNEKGNLQPSRGQARIPSISVIKNLIELAKKDGWGEFDTTRKEGM